MPGYASMPDLCEIVAVCDTNSDQARGAADTFHVAGVYSDFREMLDNENIDAVSVATPNAFHEEPAVESTSVDKGSEIIVHAIFTTLFVISIVAGIIERRREATTASSGLLESRL